MGFELRNILSSPFWLASIAIGFASWIVIIVSAIFAGADHFAIWEAIFVLIPVVGTSLAVGTDTLGAYRLALLPFYIVGVVYATITANAAIYLPLAEQKALGAGLLVLSATFFLWIIVAGVDKFLVATGLTAGGFTVTKRQLPPMYSAPNMSTRSVPSQQPVSSVSVTTTPQIAAANVSSASTTRPETAESQRSDAKPKEVEGSAALAGVHVDVAPDVVYEYRAQALYSYTASVDDPNELSFTKGDVLEIVDNQGKWWQARKADGSIGIVPSNYMKLLE